MGEGIKITLGTESNAALQGIKQFVGSAEEMLNNLAGKMLAALSAGGMVAFTKRSIENADAMEKMAQKTGIAVEQLSSLGYVAKFAEVSQGELNVALKMFAEHLQKTGKSSADLYDEILKTADEFAEMPDGISKTNIAIDKFGRAGTAMIPILNLGSERIRSLSIEAGRLGVTIGPEFASKASLFSDNMTRLKGILEGTFNQIANKILPKLIELTEWIAKHRQEIVSIGDTTTRVLLIAAGAWASYRIAVLAVTNPIIAAAGALAFFGVAAVKAVNDSNKLKNSWWEQQTNFANAKVKLMDYISDLRAAGTITDQVYSRFMLLAKADTSLPAVKATAALLEGALKNNVKPAETKDPELEIASLKTELAELESAYARGETKLELYLASKKRILTSIGVEEENRAADLKGILLAEQAMNQALADFETEAFVKRKAEAEKRKTETDQAYADSITQLQNWIATYENEIARVDSDPLKDSRENIEWTIKLLGKVKDAYEALGKITDARAHKEDLTYTERLSAQQANNAAIGGFEQSKVEIRDREARLNKNNVGVQIMSSMRSMMDEWGTMAEQIASIFKNTINTAINSVSANLTGVIMKTRNWKEALNNIYMTIMTQIIQSIIQMAIETVISGEMMKSMLKGYHALMKMLGWEEVADSNAREASKAPALQTNALANSIGSWGVAALVGLAALLGVMAVFAAGAFAGGGLVGGQGTGTSDSNLAWLSKGEYVIPEARVRQHGVGFFDDIRAGRTPAAAGVPQDKKVNVVLFDDRAKMEAWLSTAEGQNLIVNTIARNRHKLDI